MSRLVKRSQAWSSVVNPRVFFRQIPAPTDCIKPNQGESSWIKLNQAGSGRIEPHQAGSIRIKPNQGESSCTKPEAARHPLAFTLIELLVVIAIIATLAAMIFPVTFAVNRSKIRNRARAELTQLTLAIEAYKAKYGQYPPDNPGNPATNQLYFELVGTTVNPGGSAFTTLDSRSQFPIANFSSVFGPNVTGFLNCTRGSGDEGQSAANFLKGLRPNQYLIVASPPWTVLGCNLEGPLMIRESAGSTKKINPWRYNYSNPTNNSRTYDLWIDLLIGSRTNRICNWSEQPITP